MGALTSVLVADSDPLVLQALVDATAQHFPVAALLTAGNETEVLAALPRLQPPCVAVLHWSLLDADNATLRKFKDAGVPVLLISGWHAASFELATPVSARLRKPFELQEYVDLLRTLIAKWPAPGGAD